MARALLPAAFDFAVEIAPAHVGTAAPGCPAERSSAVRHRKTKLANYFRTRTFLGDSDMIAYLAN